MSSATAMLEAEIDRVGALVASLEEQRAALQTTRSKLREKIREIGAHEPADDAARQVIEKTLAHLHIEDEQTAEHERLVEHQLRERAERLDDLARNLEMIQDSSIV